MSEVPDAPNPSKGLQALKEVLVRQKGVGDAFVVWCAGFFDATNPSQSMKRLAMLLATFTLCRATIILAKAIAHTIYQGNEVPMGTVYAFAALTVPVAGLAGIVYIFKKDGTIQGGPPAPTDKDTP
jgi:hypothetical protein